MKTNAQNSSSPCTRRDFVSMLAAAGAVAPLAGSAMAQSAAPRSPAAAPAKRSGPTTIHVFSKPLHWLSYDETAKIIAETGFGGIDYSVRPAGHVLPEKVAEDFPRAVDAARKAGLKVEMITTEITSAREPHTEAVLKMAAKLGVKYYRMGYSRYDFEAGIWPSLQKLKPEFKELAELNRSLGLHGAYQNHSGPRVGGPLWDVYELLRDIDPQWLGLQYDIRHAVVEGAQSWPITLRLLAPWIKTTDIKDFQWKQSPGNGTIENVPLGEGIVPYDAYWKLVKELGISGPMSLHLEYPPFERDPRKLGDAEKRAEFVAGMKKDGATLKGWMAKHGIG
ncbi:MAG: sugar phosphate isomerase/epimerase family protein [Opitutus sp.]